MVVRPCPAFDVRSVLRSRDLTPTGCHEQFGEEGPHNGGHADLCRGNRDRTLCDAARAPAARGASERRSPTVGTAGRPLHLICVGDPRKGGIRWLFCWVVWPRSRSLAWVGGPLLGSRWSVHNTAELRCGRMIEKFPEIVTRLAGIAERFATALDCVDTGFLGDGVLDELPTGSTLGATR